MEEYYRLKEEMRKMMVVRENVMIIMNSQAQEIQQIKKKEKNCRNV